MVLIFVCLPCLVFQRGGGTINLDPCTSPIEPTLAPMVVEKTMTTRAAAAVISIFKCIIMSYIHVVSMFNIVVGCVEPLVV